MPRLSNIIRIFDYTDYRRYLHDYYLKCKSVDKAFSYRFFARKAGINSVGLYKDVIDGRQSLGRGLILKFSKAIGHTRREAEYFEHMVLFNEARSVEERKIHFERMLACCETKAAVVDARRYEYYSRWYYSAIRALLTYHPFDGDYAALGRMLDPPLRPYQVRKALVVLEQLGFIKKDEQRGYVVCDAVITTGPLSSDTRVQTMQVVEFQKAMSDLGKEAFNRHAFEQMSMSTLTVSVSKETYLAMKEEIGALRQKLARMAHDDKSPDRVYQLNYQLFPLTRNDKE